jgi:DNA-binding transcriptional MerR regulator
MTAGAMERGHRIGEVAERVGVTTRTIRYYEELGLLGPLAERSKGSHRLYSDADVGRLTELVRLRDLLGLSLEELTALAETGRARAALRDRWAGTDSDEERAHIVAAAIPILERQLALVDARRGKLDEFAAELAEKLRSLRREQRRLGRVSRPEPRAG